MIQPNKTRVKNVWNIESSKKADSDFYSVLRVALCFGRVAGTTPLTLKGFVGKRRYSTSYVLVVYGMVIVCLMTWAVYLQTMETSVLYKSMNKSRVSLISTQSVFICEVSAMVVIFVNLMLSKEKVAIILENINQQDAVLRQLGILLDYAVESKNLGIRMVVYLIIILIIPIFGYLHQLNFSFKYFSGWLTFTCSIIWRQASLYMFTTVILLVRERFKFINEHLLKMVEKAKHSLQYEVSYSRCRISSKIRSIAETHGMLCRKAMETNGIFQIPIVVVIVCNSILLTVFLYCFLHTVRDPSDEHSSGFLSFALFNCIQVIVLVILCSTTKNEAERTGKVIHRFTCSELDTGLKDAIQLFSLQLHHEKIQFSGLGLFPLDPSLIQLIAASVTGYLVILVQFDSAAGNATTCNGENSSFA